MTSSTLRLSALCLGLLALAACGKGQDQSQQKPPPPHVGVLRAQPQSAPLTKDLVGRLSAYRTADVRARVAGVLMKRVYDEGTDVKQGQTLFLIDPAPLKAALDASQGQLAQTQATYTNNQIAARRARELAPKGYVSRADLDNAQASERNSAAAVQAARANVQTARINLSYASVTAPISGRAGQQQVTEGALVGQGDTTLLTTIDQVDPLYVNFTLGSSEYNQLLRAQRKGNVSLSERNQTRVQVSLPDGTPYDQTGTLDFSDSMVSQNTGAISLRASLPNPDRTLLPGQYVTLKADLGQRKNVFLIPQQAIQRDTAGAYALVVGAGNKAVRKDVDADQVSGNNWVITRGIAAGDQVIIGGLIQAKENEPVVPEPWKPGEDEQAAQGPQGKGAAPSGKQ